MILNWLMFCLLSLNLLLLSSCCSRTTCHSLFAQTKYISQKNLPSYYVGTPQCLNDVAKIGQALLINWSIQKCQFKNHDWALQICLRLKDNREIKKLAKLSKRHGLYTMEVLNETYIDSGGIQSFKIELLADDQVVDEWLHPLWKNLINLN